MLLTSLPTRVRRLACGLATVGLALGAAVSALASQAVPLTFEQLVRGSSDIVVGRVVSRASRWGDDTKRWIVTELQVEVQEQVTGMAASSGRLWLYPEPPG